MQIFFEVASLQRKLWAVEHFFHHFWVGTTANPPKSYDKYVQLPQVSFLQNPYVRRPSLIEAAIGRRPSENAEFKKNEKLLKRAF
jgi:hypothetical protein